MLSLRTEADIAAAVRRVEQSTIFSGARAVRTTHGGYLLGALLLVCPHRVSLIAGFTGDIDPNARFRAEITEDDGDEPPNVVQAAKDIMQTHCAVCMLDKDPDEWRHLCQSCYWRLRREQEWE